MGRVSDEYPLEPVIDLSDPKMMMQRVSACVTARTGHWFWLPCPLCGLEFGGHESMQESAGKPGHVYLGGDPRISQSICPYCTMAGRGNDPRWNAADALERAYLQPEGEPGDA